MRLTRETLSRRLLIVELTILLVALVWLAFMTKLLLIWSIAGLFVILLATMIWIDKLIRHDVTNFDVCMALGAFIFAADFWAFGYKISACLIGPIGIAGVTWLVKKIIRPLSSEQQQGNLEKYRAQRRKDKFSRSLGGELAGLVGPTCIYCYILAKSGFSRSAIWSSLVILAWGITRILVLRRFPSEAQEIKPTLAPRTTE